MPRTQHKEPITPDRVQEVSSRLVSAKTQLVNADQALEIAQNQHKSKKEQLDAAQKEYDEMLDGIGQ